MKGEGVPKYLRKGWKENKQNRVSWFKLGNEMREGDIRRGKLRGRYKIVWGGMESWEHLWEKCREGREEVGRRQWDGC